MFTDEAPPKRTIVQKLEAPASVVSYRAIVGAISIATFALLSWLGSRVVDTQDHLQDGISRIRVEITKTNGILSADHDRIGNVEAKVNTLNDKADALDHRVTVLEVTRAH